MLQIFTFILLLSGTFVRTNEVTTRTRRIPPSNSHLKSDVDHVVSKDVIWYNTHDMMTKKCSNLCFSNDTYYEKYFKTLNAFARNNWSVHIGNASSSKLCEGVLIDDKIVLAIGDCVHGQDLQNLKISLQKWSLPDSSTFEPHKVTKVNFHPEYKFSSPSNNLALLYLDKPFDFINSTQLPQVCLPNENDTLGHLHRCITEKYYPVDDYRQVMDSIKVVNSICHESQDNSNIMCTYSELYPYNYFRYNYEVTQSSPLYCRVSNNNRLQYKLAGLVFSPLDNNQQIPYQVIVSLSGAHGWINEHLTAIDTFKESN